MTLAAIIRARPAQASSSRCGSRAWGATRSAGAGPRSSSVRTPRSVREALHRRVSPPAVPDGHRRAGPGRYRVAAGKGRDAPWLRGRASRCGHGRALRRQAERGGGAGRAVLGAVGSRDRGHGYRLVVPALAVRQTASCSVAGRVACAGASAPHRLTGPVDTRTVVVRGAGACHAPVAVSCRLRTDEPARPRPDGWTLGCSSSASQRCSSSWRRCLRRRARRMARQGLGILMARPIWPGRRSAGLGRAETESAECARRSPGRQPLHFEGRSRQHAAQFASRGGRDGRRS
jgi:hypothetical protein